MLSVWNCRYTALQGITIVFKHQIVIISGIYVNVNYYHPNQQSIGKILARNLKKDRNNTEF